MSKFEDRLWRELVRRHGADLAQMTRPAGERARRARPRLLAGTTVGLAGIGTAAALLLSAASSPPAFAVSRNADGSVTVSIQQIGAIHAANARLAALGVRAKLVEVTPGCANRALPPAAVHAMALAKQGAAMDGAAQAPVAQLDPRTIPPGKWQVLPTERIAGHVKIAPGRLAAAPAPACLSTLPQAAVGRCPDGAQTLNLKHAPPPPTYRGLIRRARASAKAAATFHATTGNPGNSGNSGNSGNPGNSGYSENSGNSGTAGPSSTQTAVKHPPKWVVIGCQITTPAPGHSGNSGNSGNSGISGNS